MEFKVGDVVEINKLGKTEFYEYKQDIVLNSLYLINYDLFNDFECINMTTKRSMWINKKYLQISKSYYRKEKLKQLKNEI